jgi:hypothetical protein
MRNPRQPSAKIDLQLIADATRLFDKIYVRSELADKMTALTCRFEREATTALGYLSKNQDSTIVDKASAVASSTSLPSGDLCEGQTNHVGIGKIAENHGKQIIKSMTALARILIML